MRYGQDAIDYLVQGFPDAYRHFAEQRSTESMAVLLSGARWLVVEVDDCFVFAEQDTPIYWDIHWFCPRGANLPAQRKLLTRVFAMTGAWAVGGKVPPGHPNERQARAVNRSLGAIKGDDTYLLTKERHLAYNCRDTSNGD